MNFEDNCFIEFTGLIASGKTYSTKKLHEKLLEKYDNVEIISGKNVPKKYRINIVFVIYTIIIMFNHRIFYKRFFKNTYELYKSFITINYF